MAKTGHPPQKGHPERPKGAKRADARIAPALVDLKEQIFFVFFLSCVAKHKKKKHFLFLFCLDEVVIETARDGRDFSWPTSPAFQRRTASPGGASGGFRVTLGIKAFGVAKILVRSPEVLALTHCYPPRPPEGPRMGAPPRRGWGSALLSLC